MGIDHKCQVAIKALKKPKPQEERQRNESGCSSTRGAQGRPTKAPFGQRLAEYLGGKVTGTGNSECKGPGVDVRGHEAGVAGARSSR